MNPNQLPSSFRPQDYRVQVIFQNTVWWVIQNAGSWEFPTYRLSRLRSRAGSWYEGGADSIVNRIRRLVGNKALVASVEVIS